MKLVKTLLVVVGLVATALYPVAAQARDANPPVAAQSDNVKLVEFFAKEGGGELAAQGKFVYSGQANGGPEFHRGSEPDQGGLHVYDVSGKKPKQVGFLHCPGTDNDVEIVRPGLATMSFSGNTCAPQVGTGLMTIDVSNPRNPRVLGAVTTGAAHTHKPYPGKPLVYMAGGGLTPGTGMGPVIVDVSKPSKPKVVAEAQTLTMDCHDISFHITKEKKLMFCPGAIGTGEVQIFDVSDPLDPQLISKIYNPLIQYSHYAVASSDGNLLAIDDEAFALHECHTGQSPTGRVWIYDISNPMLPLLQGSFAPPRGGDGTIGHFLGWVPSWCLAHGLDWQPGTHNLAVTWFTGGMSVLDVSTPSVPSEAAFYQVENAAAFSALWHGGRLWVNDTRYGVQVFDIKGLPK